MLKKVHKFFPYYENVYWVLSGINFNENNRP